MVLALGSNLGDRVLHLRRGLEALARVVRIEAVSSVYESRPVGYRAQPDFLNLVIVGETGLAPEELLARMQEVERAAGRERSFRNGPRTLDIDLIFFGGRLVEGERLRVPHPRWSERAFVLAPLQEIAPSWTDPVSGCTVAALWGRRRGELEPAHVVAPPSAVWEVG